MEQQLWRETEEKFNTSNLIGDSNNNNNNAISLQTLSSCRSLIINPSTSNLTISSILKTLIHTLFSSNHRHYHHHIFSLLSTLSFHHPSFSPSISSSILSLSSSLISDPSSSPRLAAAALSLLLSISAVDDLDDSLLVSLCFRPCMSVRVWFLNNALKFSIRPNLLLTVMLGFSEDPIPCVRKAALEGLVRICDSGIFVEDSAFVEGCYFRAVELLGDQHDYVRFSAVRAVRAWGCMHAESKPEEEIKGTCFNGVFLQICSMVRDMNVEVRVEAFTALGKIAYISGDILLQTMSKRVLGTIKEKQSLAWCSSHMHKIHASVAAGLFVHGLEDEYSEVQQAACISLRMLPVISDQFASEAVNILKYGLHGDTTVRLEALKTIHHIVLSGCLKMQEENIDMLLGTLLDSSSEIRSRAFNLLESVKLPGLKVFKSTVESLLKSVDMYPKSEAQVFCTLFSIGQNHGNYAVRIMEDFYAEIEPSSNGKLGCNRPRVVGLLVLAISASMKHEKHFIRIPPWIFSYAAAYFGRISLALRDILDVDSLLAYLSYCNWHFMGHSETKTRSDILSAAKGQQEASEHVLSAVKLILQTVERLWKLVKCGCTDEMIKALRYCKESLMTVKAGSFAHAGVVAFALQYIRIVKILTEVWEIFVVSKHCLLSEIGDMDLLLGKLDKALLDFRYRFIGLSENVELIIMELLLLNYLLQLSSPYTHGKAFHKLCTVFSYVCHLRNAKSIACSDFVNQFAELSYDGCLSLEATRNPIQLKKLLDLFLLKELGVSQGIKHIKADICVLGFDSVSPLQFISGLPVAIPLEITLYNMTNDHRLWLKITLNDKLTEYFFLDMEEYGGPGEPRQFKCTLPFYRTPEVVAFTLRISMGMECLYEDLHLWNGHGGPKHALTFISPEIEVDFSNLKTPQHDEC
ncbi:protein SIEL isoform X2 [Amaranthus tricolor]|uniref:protein SIEL isoform X2 n=1 Tax=Amaranthus tricolor TaxID=29722 RepID=UPI0025871029|nr:protein SIEL isoform X2 [Amaranthus tricolor]